MENQNHCPKCGAEGYKEKIEAKYQQLAQKFLDSVIGRGYQFSKKDEFYITRDFRVGIKIGQYEHRCHIDSSSYIVLLIKKINTDDFGIEEFENYEIERVKF